MRIAVRNATVVWNGTLARGAGELSSGSGTLDLPVTWASRTERADGKTSPEELIAAAHASCYAMALALVLGENDTPPERLAHLTMRAARPGLRPASSPSPHRCRGSTGRRSRTVLLKPRPSVPCQTRSATTSRSPSGKKSQNQSRRLNNPNRSSTARPTASRFEL